MTSAARLLIGTILLVSASLACAADIEPPPVVLRDIANMPRVARGTTVSLASGLTLFLPEGWREEITSSSGVRLSMHFHGAPWFVIEEHARRGARHPLVAGHFGQGSSVYRKPFLDPGLFDAILTTATAELIRHGAAPDVRFEPIELQSFSAGYGAVREILKSPANVRRIERVVLADSLYSSRTTDTRGRAVPDPQQMASFVNFARLAVCGEKQLLAAHSTIVTPSYCSTVETADALIEAVGGAREPVTTGSLAAAAEGSSFPLTSRCDMCGFHVWGYEGRTGLAHMAVARTIADFYEALERERSLATRP